MEIVRLDPADPESVDAAFSEIRRRFGEPPRAMRRGLTGSIMRLTTVCGDRVDNRPNPEDFFWRVVAFVIELGAAPDGERPLAFTPIDETVAAVIGLAGDPLSLSKAHHLCGATSLRWRDAARVLNRMGYSVALLPGPQWVARVRSEAARHSESRLWREILPIVGDARRDHETFIPVLSDITRRRLGELGLPFRAMDEPLLEANLRRLVHDGALPRAFSSRAG
jgi:thioester reductase-like protein